MVLEHPGPVKVLGPGRCKRFSAYIDDGKVRHAVKKMSSVDFSVRSNRIFSIFQNQI